MSRRETSPEQAKEVEKFLKKTTEGLIGPGKLETHARVAKISQENLRPEESEEHDRREALERDDTEAVVDRQVEESFAQSLKTPEQMEDERRAREELEEKIRKGDAEARQELAGADMDAVLGGLAKLDQKKPGEEEIAA